ncbi:MAG: pseudouridine synthase [Bacteroidales bacterium]|nr:pseudouridine synthase [Bacteroidales bacterium]
MNKREFKDNKKSYGNRGSRPSRKFSGSGSDRRAPRRKFDDDDRERPRRRFNDDDEERPRRRFKDGNGERPRRKFDSENEERPRRKYNSDSEDRPRRRFNRDNDGDFKDKGFGRRKFDGDRPKRRFDGERSDDGRPRRKFEGALSDEERLTRKLERRKNFGRKDEEKRPRRRDVTAESEILTEIVERRKAEGRQAKPKQKVLSLEQEEEHGPIRLNKYISNAGICSRRDADTLITAGAIMVNGEVVTELGTKVMPTDEVRYGDQVLQREKPVYILLNKPKDYITTTFDERDRKNVMELIKGACKEHVYPVGRLDKNTTGILLFTNNGEMAKKLMHPRSNIKKIYHVELDKNLKQSDFNAIVEGLELDDGPIVPDELSYVGDSKNEVGIAIHSGRNRIVRRIFESLDYKVVKLDRVFFAGLTKKDLPRGSWRFLTQAEINILNMLPAIN